jgi:hypothetical protein
MTTGHRRDRCGSGRDSVPGVPGRNFRPRRDFLALTPLFYLLFKPPSDFRPKARKPLKRNSLLAISVAGILCATILAPSAAGAAKVTVSPGPTARNASVWTEISFRGVRAGKAGKIKVRGSRSGRHGHKRRAHSDGKGFSLLLRRALRTSEWVSVRSGLRIAGTRRGDYRFRVENIGGPRTKRTGNSKLAPAGPPRYRSRPDLVPPVLDVRRSTPSAGTDPLFVGSKSRGGAIYGPDGEPVWFRAMRSTDFRTQTYHGRPVLTWFESPTKGSGLKRASYTIANRAYKIIRRITPGNGYSADSHEFRLTPRGTAYITSYRPVRRDLRFIGLPRNGRVSDSVAQEIDLRTGRVIWEWHSLDHVPVRHSYANGPKFPGNPYDYFHINSIVDTPDGNVLISGRSTNAVYKVNRRTGRVIWTLGGKGSDFKLGPGALFSWQHDAQPLSGNRVSIFDNADSPVADSPWADQSRGIVLQLDNRKKTATLATEFTHPSKPLAPTQANVQPLESGNFLVGWGQVPLITEHTPDGTIVFDAMVRDTGSFYRAYRQPWSGRPKTRVDVATEALGAGATRVWASWNGDSSVRTWRVLAGPGSGALAPAGEFSRTGFETVMDVPTGAARIKVEGLNANGKVIGSSAVKSR